jgi:branched-chain amino acid transport system ATP-binding protein
MMLEVEDLRVSYGHIDAVDGVSLQIDSGEAVAFLGPNGAGKTSTLAAISGLVGSSGQIRFDGEPLRGRHPEAIARAGLVHVPEGRHVFGNLSVHENLQVATSARARREATFGFDDVYDLFPSLVPLRRRPGWALSGGEQQMVAVGRALLGSPRLLMLDEPSLGLAPIVANAVFDALAQVRSQVSLLVVEQNTSQALDLCDRAYVLVEGRIVLDRRRDELADRTELLDTYLGRADLDAPH